VQDQEFLLSYGRTKLHANQDIPNAEVFLSAYRGEIMILVLSVLVVISLIILVPQLLRSHLHKVELLHTEHLKALEQGMTVPPPDESTAAAGRTALLVPMVAVISAATVTCFLVAYRDNNVFSVALAVWAVVGVVSLAAITGGVALLGRLAQLQSGIEDREDEEEQPTENPI
jgi:hypothetical protein